MTSSSSSFVTFSHDNIKFRDADESETITITVTADVVVELRAKTTHPNNVVTKPAKAALAPGIPFPIDVVYRPPLPKDGPSAKLQFVYKTTPNGEREGTTKMKVTFGKQQGSSSNNGQLERRVSSASIASSVVSSVVEPSRPPQQQQQFEPYEHPMNPLISESTKSSTHQPPPPPTMPLQKQQQPYSSSAAARNSNVQVYVRVRPFLTSISEDTTPYWILNSQPGAIGDQEQLYEFDAVIQPESNNADVFEQCRVAQFVECMSQGINGTLFVYGQTCSGKTHTMFGHPGSEAGIVELLLSSIFSYAHHNAANFTSRLVVSFFEVYNEEVNDLLSKGNSAYNLPVREDRSRGFVVPGLTETPVVTVAQCLSLLHDGYANRKLGFSNINEHSSRSHTVLRVECVMEDTAVGAAAAGSGPRKTRRSVLCMVDLAGSETISDRGGATQRRETSHINVSLSHLKQLIMDLSNGEKFVNYRNSILTKILKQSLGGNSRTVMVCTITPSVEYLKETKSTLRFGTLAKTIKNTIAANVTVSDEGHLREDNARLREQLARAHEQIKEMENLQRNLVSQQQLEQKQQKDVEEVQSLREMILSLQRDKNRIVAEYEAKIEQVREEAKDSVKEKEESMLQIASQANELQNVLRKDNRIDSVMSQVLQYIQYGCRVERVMPDGQLSKEAIFLSQDKSSVHCCHVRNTDGEPSRASITDTVTLTTLECLLLGQYTTGLQQASRTDCFHKSMSLKIAGGRTMDVIFSEDNDFEAWTIALNALCRCRVEWGKPLEVAVLPGHDSLDASEAQFCARMHIAPMLYLSAKTDVLTTTGTYVTLFDIRTITSLDLFHAARLLSFFVERGWVSRRNLFVVGQANLGIKKDEK
eukprot:PhM_4_TR8793/c0_g1_i2/m.80393